MEAKATFLIEAEGAAQRIDKFLSEKLPDMTRSSIQRLLDAGEVSCNGKQVGKNYRLKQGDRLDVVIPDPAPMELLPEDIPLDVCYEDQRCV